MSLFQMFDQFCFDFCQAWGFDTSPMFNRQVVTMVYFSFTVAGCCYFWYAFYQLLTAIVYRFTDFMISRIQQFIKKIKSR